MRASKRMLQRVLLVAATILVCGCETTTQGGAVGVDRSQFMVISTEQRNQIAAQSYTKLRQDATAKGELNSNPDLTRRVRAIATRIEPETKVFRPDAPAWPWEVNVITSKELNAFCMPGGK